MLYRELFGVPIFKTKFDKHERVKAEYLNFLEDKKLYEKNTSAPRLQFTHPNLHREGVFADFTAFVTECLTESFISLGFVPSFQITGMWATKHPTGGYHHLHSHGNSFLAGVYYLDGGNSPAGTRFNCPHRYWNTIIPAKLSETSAKTPKNREIIPFEEGNLVIFPAWLEHQTNANTEEKERTILSFNVMPLGKTNADTFDRFCYKESTPADMINYNSEKVRS